MGIPFLSIDTRLVETQGGLTEMENREDDMCISCENKYQGSVNAPKAQNSCIECQRKRKTFDKVPAFLRSNSCPADKHQNVKYQHVNAIIETHETSKNNSGFTSVTVGGDIKKTPNRKAKCSSKKLFLCLCVCFAVMFLYTVALTIYTVVHTKGDDFNKRKDDLDRIDPYITDQRTTVKRRCLLTSTFGINWRSFLDGNYIPLITLESTDGSEKLTTLSGDGDTITVLHEGYYDITLGILIDTYSLKKYQADQSYHQNVCLYADDTPNCRPVVLRSRMKIPIQIQMKRYLERGQSIYVSVEDLDMVSDNYRNTLTIASDAC